MGASRSEAKSAVVTSVGSLVVLVMADSAAVRCAVPKLVSNVLPIPVCRPVVAGHHSVYEARL